MASPLVAAKLQKLGLRTTVRKAASGAEYITDEGNLILDCEGGEIEDPHRLADSIRQIVGVVEHGLFLGMANIALIAGDAEITELTR